MKWRPESSADGNSLYLGAASMHNGSGIYRISNSDSGSASSEDTDSALTITTIATQIDSNEDRLVYGMDWLSSNVCKEKQVTPEETRAGSASTICENSVESAAGHDDPLDYEIATCSFYDNLVQVWSS